MLTPDSVIDDLGGTKVVALALSVDVSTVSGWRVRGIPPARCRSLSKLALERGVADITLDALLEMTDPACAEART